MASPKHVVEYGLVRLLEALICFPPLGAALRFGERLGYFSRRLLPRRDALIVSNLSAAFPEKSRNDIRAIADAVWRNIGRVAVEFIRSPEILTKDRVRVVGGDVVEAAAAEGKGLIFLTPHYCNWEYTGILTQRYFGPVIAIVRPMRNPLVDAWVRGKRSLGGVPVILHRKAAKETLRILRGKGRVGILSDQNLYKGGVFVNFFNRPAATTTLPALLHERTGAPVILLHVERDADASFRLVAERLHLPETGEGADRIVAGTQAVNDAMEKVVRARPDWWFWIHNRWKRSAEAAAQAS